MSRLGRRGNVLVSGGHRNQKEIMNEPSGTLISILLPFYNEEEFLETIVERVFAAPLPEGVAIEVVAVDDASTDESPEIAAELARRRPGVFRVFRHSSNQGKGAAIRTALEQANGELCIIQDADLEYDPREYGALLAPLLEGKADVVYGSRFLSSGQRRVLYFWHAVANRVLTTACNIVSDLNLTDMETCYKAFRTSLGKSIPIRSNRFGIEPELTIKFAKRRARIYETAITYNGRTYSEGKKIGFWDAIEALWVIVSTAVRWDVYKDAGPEVLDAIAAAPRFNRWMADTIRPFVGKRILEIGAGIGNLTTELVSRRSLYVVADIDTEHLARLANRFSHRPRIRIRRCDLEAPEDFAEFCGELDTVICLNVLEHVKNDPLALQNMFSVLRPGGRAIILVPNDQRVYGTLDEALGHFRRYSREELAGKMEASGFKVEQVIDFNRITYPNWYIAGRILKQRSLRPLQLRVFDQFVGIWRRIDGILPWQPTSIIAIGRREG